jgi:hypothetical protein
VIQKRLKTLGIDASALGPRANPRRLKTLGIDASALGPRANARTNPRRGARGGNIGWIA